MRSILAAALLLSTFSSCTYPVPTKGVLFAQAESSDGNVGGAILMATSADLSCGDFKDGVESGELLVDLNDERSMMLSFQYSLWDSTDSEAWVGMYAPNAYELDMDKAEDEEEDHLVMSSRRVYSTWYVDGSWVDESAGLTADLSEYSSDSIKVKMTHIWNDARLSAENCGTYE